MKASGPMIAGTKFNLEIDAVAKSESFMLVFGTSNKTWSGVPLPFNTGNIGLPGCFLNVCFDKVTSLTSDANGKLVLPIDATNMAGGVRLYSQIVVPQSVGYKIATSQGYELDLQKSVKSFRIVVLPDTQHYVIYQGWMTHFSAMTQWIVDNRVAKNLSFASHVGDIVVNGAIGTNQNKAQWDRADSAISKLDGDLNTKPDGVIPYSTTIGNRDYDLIHVKGAATQFLNYFGPTRCGTRKWWGGAGPDGLSAYQILEANGQKILHLALEWRPDDKVIIWARKILTANPSLPAIVSTHQYLSTTGFDNAGTTPNTSGDNGGNDIRNKLVEPFPQIFLVLCGHHPGGAHRTQPTIFGQNVMEVMSDYSSDPEGGNGWMNIIDCQPDNAKILNQAFSPTYKVGTSAGPNRALDPKNNSSMDLDLHAHRRMLETTSIIRFTGRHDSGHGTYAGAIDTHVSSSTATTSYGSAPDLTVNDPSGPDEQQGLIKFGGLFGAGSGQVPTNKRILRATLTLTTEGTGAKSVTVSNVYQLRVPFTETSTWSNLTSGIQVGTDTVATAVASTGTLLSTEGTRSFDVTASVQAWQAGTKNHGWAVLSSGTDSWSFRSQDWSEPAERPMLTIQFEK